MTSSKLFQLDDYFQSSWQTVALGWSFSNTQDKHILHFQVVQEDEPQKILDLFTPVFTIVPFLTDANRALVFPYMPVHYRVHFSFQ